MDTETVGHGGIVDINAHIAGYIQHHFRGTSAKSRSIGEQIDAAVFVSIFEVSAAVDNHIGGSAFGEGELEQAVIFIGGVAGFDVMVFQQDFVIVGVGGLEIVIKTAGGGVILRFAGTDSGHNCGSTCHKAEDLVGDVHVFHAGAESGTNHCTAMGRLDAGGGGLEQVADGTDVGVYILGIIDAIHGTFPFCFSLLKT